MKRYIFACVVAMWSPFSQASIDLACEYVPSAAAKKTKISFSLSKPVRFGQLVPVEIKPEDGSSVIMNTVVLKDHPYLVLADVYRIETNNSRIALLKVSPDKTSVEMAYVNMGEKQSAKFYQGKCYATGEMK